MAGIAESATNLIGWINNHGKVRKMFDAAQSQISLDHMGQSVVLAYLSANLTQWTTHCIAFIRLLRVRDALQLEVIQHRSGIIKGQVGAATSSEKQRLTQDVEAHCNLIADHSFWDSLEHVVGDIKPICYRTNINQKDSTRADQVLLTLAGMYIHFSDHPISDVANGMTKHLEKRWKDCDQPLFLLALILNPFEGLSCFGEKAGMNHFKCNNLLIAVCDLHSTLHELHSQSISQMYRRMQDQPSNQDTPDVQLQKEQAISTAFMRYLTSVGPFASWKDEQAEWEILMASY